MPFAAWLRGTPRVLRRPWHREPPIETDGQSFGVGHRDPSGMPSPSSRILLCSYLPPSMLLWTPWTKTNTTMNCRLLQAVHACSTHKQRWLILYLHQDCALCSFLLETLQIMLMPYSKLHAIKSSKLRRSPLSSHHNVPSAQPTPALCVTVTRPFAQTLRLIFMRSYEGEQEATDLAKTVRAWSASMRL